MEMKIALAGNPNSGKTTMFNELTGTYQRVGNWPGVTVERKEGRLKWRRDVAIQDLPGIYSLSPYTAEEVIARDYLVKTSPDAIINIVDGTNLERNLYLTTQLLELGIPVVVAVNMLDAVEKSGDEIDLFRLGEALGCAVVGTSALKGEGVRRAAEKAVELAEKKEAGHLPPAYGGAVGRAIARIEKLIEGKAPPRSLRWHAVKLFERDGRVAEELGLEKPLLERIGEVVAECEAEMGDDAESLITALRYEYIAAVVEKAVVKKRGGAGMSVSDRIDRVVTGKFLAIPIFAAVMFLVYWVSISTVGAWATDWTNDVLIGGIVCGNLRQWLEGAGVSAWMTGLVVDGVVGGVGAVIGFVPQMIILFFMLSVLEDVGYMARVAFIMDRLFRRFGLSGKSFIPMLISSGCGVPGVMACRTIESERDRRLTVMTTTFIPCGAKMPIVALFAGALFGGSGLVAVSAYFIGAAAVVVSGVILKKTRIFSGDVAPFVMELPAYRVPSAKNVFRSTFERGWSFVRRAGTIILVSSVALWLLQSVGFSGGALRAVEDSGESLLAGVGSLIAPALSPLGFGDWKSAVATITGLIAKENVVATLGVLHGFAELAEDGAEMWASLKSAYTPLSAYSFMVFNLLCAPCFAAIGAIRREMNSSKWTWGAVGYMCAFAYAVSLTLYQLGLLFAGEGFTPGSVAGLVALALIVYMAVRKGGKNERRPSAGKSAVGP